ncbi:hypothetical protein AVEN_12280-1 [Araneus ventricosus]|uniref:Uncharacterized protein n=1 Tax=Araneus ventricosus TaxID=182803 RepID=A0A4Y2HCK0_ARAVE|nr:hypothetical protein AVEN_12280-1 [Araneus ventricosus]
MKNLKEKKPLPLYLIDVKKHCNYTNIYNEKKICYYKVKVVPYRQTPLKQRVLGRKRHELDSPNLGGYLPHHPAPSYNLPLRHTEMAVVGKDNWTPYSAYLLSDLRTSPQKKPTA